MIYNHAVCLLHWYVVRNKNWNKNSGINSQNSYFSSQCVEEVWITVYLYIQIIQNSELSSKSLIESLSGDVCENLSRCSSFGQNNKSSDWFNYNEEIEYKETVKNSLEGFLFL